MDENQKIIYDLLKEVRGDQKKDSQRIERVDVSISEMQIQQKQMRHDLEDVKHETTTNTRHMGEHMARTELAEQGLKMLTDLHKDNQKRIEMLETDAKKKDQAIIEIQRKRDLKEASDKGAKNFKNTIKKNITWIITVVAALVGVISKLMGLW